MARREEREGRRGKVSGAGPAFFPLISSNSSNHNDRRRAREGESEQGKGEIGANGRSQDGEKERGRKKRAKEMEGGQKREQLRFKCWQRGLKKELKIEQVSMNGTTNQTQKKK